METTIYLILTNQQIPETCPELLYDVIWAGLRSGAALSGSSDVTRHATWRPPCGVRRVIQKHSQLYQENQICLEQIYMDSQYHHQPP